MRNRNLKTLLLLTLMVAPVFLRAQGAATQPDLLSMSLEDLMKVEIDSVYGASGYKQKVADTPASITIVTAEEIKRYGYRTLADVLRNVPGFCISSDRGANSVGVRGFGPPGDYNSRILLLVDGHRVNDPVSGGAGVGTDFPIDIDLIDRVEVIRGPNSSVYIASALLGVVNVVTRRGSDVAGLSVSQEFASFNTYKSRVTYGRQFKSGLEILVSGTYSFSHGPDKLYFREFDSPATNNGIAANADGARFNQQFAKISYRGFTLQAAYGSSEQTDPTASYGTIFNDPEERLRLMPGYVDLGYDHDFGGDWGYQARVFYDNDRYRGTYPIDESSYGGDSHVLNEDRTSGQDVGASFAVSKKLPGRQTLIAGSEYRDNFQQNQWNYDREPYALYFTSHERSSLWGAHVQDEIPLGKKLVLDLGLSYDHYSTFGSTVNPRADLIFQPRKGSTFKLLYGQSFRPPTAFELYYTLPGQESNPFLKPETARTTELVWEQTLSRNFLLVVSGYYYPIRAVISAVTDPASGIIVYQNSQVVNLSGGEFTLKRQSSSGLEAGVSVSVESAQNPHAPGPLVNSPHVLGQGSLSVPLLNKKLFASVNLQGVGKRRTEAGNFSGAYAVPNFTLYSPNPLRRWEFSASVYNAFDEVYGDPASVAHIENIIFQNGRNFRIKFTYHY